MSPAPSGAKGRWRRAFEAAVLLAVVSLPFLGSGVGAAAVGLTTIAWLLTRPPRREAYVAGGALLAAALILAGGSLWSQRAPAGKARWLAAAEEPYHQLWQDLEDQAKAAAARLPELPESSSRASVALRQDVFDRLEKASAGGATLVLLDSLGQVWAWAGGGLLQQVGSENLPRSQGRGYRAGFGAVTLLQVETIGDGGRAWRLVAGKTLSADVLPFPSPGGWRRGDFRWSLVDRPEQADPGTWVLSPKEGLAPEGGVVSEELPLLVVDPAPGAKSRRRAPPPWLLPLALCAVALALLALAVLRGVGLALRSEGSGELAGGVELLTLGGLAACAYAATASALATAALVLGLGLAAVGLRQWDKKREEEASRPLLGAALAVLAVLGIFGAAWGAQQWRGVPTNLAQDLLVSPVLYCLRLAFWAAAFGILLLVSRSHGRQGKGRDLWAVAAVLLLAAAAAFHDAVLVALILLVAGTVAGARWLNSPRPRGRLGIVALAATLAALLAAGAWETAYRLQVRQALERDIISRMAPPSEADLRKLGDELREYFAKLDLDDFSPRSLEGLDSQDLAFLLWKQSPLARRNAVTALVIAPEADVPTSFAFGLSVSTDLDEASLPPTLRGLPRWDSLEERGIAELGDRGEPWGRVEYWIRPRPGFFLDSRPLGEDVAAGLLAGGEAPGTTVEGLPGGALYGLYEKDGGRALLTPWEEAPPLPPETAEGGRGRRIVETPAGSSWAFSRLGSDGWEVLFLPRLEVGAGLERVGTHAAGALLLVALAGLLILVLALPRPAFRSLLQQARRSYSKRMLIVYTLLVLVPLPLLNFALITGVKESLWRQQRAAGEEALLAAQQYLGRELESLPLGSSIDFNAAERLQEMSAIVRHDLNLYYGSRSSRVESSRPELFSAGLLPKRVPGEVFARLALGGYNLTSRTRSVEGTEYAELYAPLRLSDGRASRFFLSVPLLSQQEEVAAELGHLRRQALLITAVLFMLLATASVRLARGFAAPITELVEGTRRIALGAASLDVTPSDLELAALAEAVDEMAARIDLGRKRLLREKQVVERIVEHITSGVISLDRERRVLMQNRVAQEFLQGDIGEPLDVVVGRGERLAPVADFLSWLDQGEGIVQRTVRLAEEGGEEREWSLVWVPIPGGGEPSALLVVDDATEVLRGQRLEAWAEMARIIAHEIKNPLTPIRLSAEHMREVHGRDPERFDGVFERCTNNILTQVEELRQIASEFSTYSSILHIDPKLGDLGEATAQLLESYLAAPPPGVNIFFEGPGEPVEARFDARLLGRALRNLVENAVRASAGGGEVRVRLVEQGGVAKIQVLDTGPGVEAPLLGRIFDPYFSTHDTGTGLGLPISRRIAEEHGGSIVARNREGGGLEVEITIPTA